MVNPMGVALDFVCPFLGWIPRGLVSGSLWWWWLIPLVWPHEEREKKWLIPWVWPHEDSEKKKRFVDYISELALNG